MTAEDRDLEWIVGRITSRCDPSAVYLFGSQARQTAHLGSDIDLLIVAPSQLPRSHRGREVIAALAAFPARFDLLFYTEAELVEECVDPLSFVSTLLIGARRLYPTLDPPSALDRSRSGGTLVTG